VPNRLSARLRSRSDAWLPRRLRLCCLLAVLQAAPAAWAQPKPAAQPSAPQPPCAPDLQATLAQQLALEAHCATQPDFLLHLGTQLNHAQRYPEALARLESALMLRPDHVPTLLEFALALAGSSDIASAQQTLLQLERSAALDPAQQLQVRHVLMRLAAATHPPTSAATPARPSLRASLQLSLAHDTQLQALPRASSFELTLPSGSIWLQPDQAASQSGTVFQADFQLAARLQPRWYARAQIGLRSVQHASPSSSATMPPAQPAHPDRQHWSAGLSWVPPTQRPQQLELNLRGIALSGRSVYQQIGLTWLHTLAPSTATASQAATPAPTACAPTLGLELQQQRYSQLPVLDGHYVGLLWRQPCLRTQLLPDLWLQGRAGFDQPSQAQRPGGRQSIVAIQLAWPHSAPSQPSAPGWNAQAEFSWVRDARGYSPLLAHGQPRWQLRQHLRLEHRWPVGWPAPAWQAHVWADTSLQRSNLALFDLRPQHSVGLSLRHIWQ